VPGGLIKSQVFSKNVKKMQTASVHKNGHSQLLQVQLFWEHSPRLSMQLFMGNPWLINVSHQFLRCLFLAISQTNLWYYVCVYMCVVVYLYIIIYTIRWYIVNDTTACLSIPRWESWWRAYQIPTDWQIDDHPKIWVYISNLWPWHICTILYNVPMMYKLSSGMVAAWYP